MKKYSNKSIGFTIITSTIGIVALLITSIFITNYINFNKNIQEATNVQTNEIARQIVYNYENYISIIIKTSNLIQVDIANDNIEEETTNVSNYLLDIIRLNNEIINIGIYTTEGKCIASSNISEINKTTPLSECWLNNAVAEPTIHIFSLPYEINDTYIITISKYISYDRSSENGILKIEINFDNLIELAKKSNLGENGHISIIDAKYNIIYSSKSSNSPFND